MDFMGSGSDDIHEKAKKMMGTEAENAPEHHDFFKPLNEMDPLTRAPKAVEPPVFKFRVFRLAGALAEPSEGMAYEAVMNKVTIGEYQMLDDHVYHTKDGDISILVRWLELPAALRPGARVSPEEEELASLVETKDSDMKKKTAAKSKKAAPPIDPMDEVEDLNDPEGPVTNPKIFM